MDVEHCPSCGRAPVVVKHEPEHEVIWGNPNFKYGEHRFVISTEYIHCENCGESYYTFDQSMAHSRAINEQVKAKLGINWLAENKKRREEQKQAALEEAQNAKEEALKWFHTAGIDASVGITRISRQYAVKINLQTLPPSTVPVPAEFFGVPTIIEVTGDITKRTDENRED